MAMQRRTFETILVGPNALAREGLSRILRAAGFRIPASVPAITDAALDMLARDQIILLVLDAGTALPGAIDQIETFKRQRPDGRVAILASHYKLVDIVSAFQAGANACFVNVADATAFVKSLELVMLGETLLPPEILPLILSHEDPNSDNTLEFDAELAPGVTPDPDDDYMPQLSAREDCILRCLTEGQSNKMIARRINIAEATVKVHIKAILRKIRVHNRTQAAIWAINHSTMSAGQPAIAVSHIGEAVEQPEHTSKLEPPVNGAAQRNGGQRKP
jgi:two-component system, NarL family, nitrate/nitrite response regulator NarL